MRKIPHLKIIVIVLLIFVLSPIGAWLAWWNLPNNARESLFGVFWSETPDLILGDQRPALTFLPEGYDDNPEKDYPLLVALHGYQSFPSENAIYFDLVEQAHEKGFVLMMPQGEIKPSKNARFWNATEDCCADDIPVDDVGYIKNLVIEAKSKLRLNEDQIFLFGYSNGGYMGYRMSCEDAGLFKGVVVFAGLGFKDESMCISPTPRTLIHFHGTQDSIVRPDASNRKKAASVDEMLSRWQKRNSCGDPQVSLNKYDIGRFEGGPETDFIAYKDCQPGYSLSYFRMNNLTHIPAFKSNLIDLAWPILMKDSEVRTTQKSQP